MPDALSDRLGTVVIGDMRGLYHHGSTAVMEVLHAGLDAVGLRVEKFVPGFEWRHPAYEDLCLNAPLVVINGEGAMHDDSPATAAALNLAEARRRRGGPTALINSCWYRNTPEATSRLKAFALISTRDSASAEEIGRHSANCRIVPDLAIGCVTDDVPVAAAPRDSQTLVGDSTKTNIASGLYQLARKRGWRYLPILAPPRSFQEGSKAAKIRRRTRLYRGVAKIHPLLVPIRYRSHLCGAGSTRDYCAELSAAQGGVITGRFHTACLCIALGVPFIAVRSNTGKIENLLRDAGLVPERRVVRYEELQTVASVPPFDSHETEQIRAFQSHAAERRSELFRCLRELVTHEAA